MIWVHKNRSSFLCCCGDYILQRRTIFLFYFFDLHNKKAAENSDFHLTFRTASSKPSAFIVDPGHHVEKVMIQGVAQKMSTLCENKKLPVEFIQSKIHTEPFQFI